VAIVRPDLVKTRLGGSGEVHGISGSQKDIASPESFQPGLESLE